MRDISLTYQGTELALVKGEVIPITKQVNEVGDLNVFKADFSRQFKIKRTREVERAFESAGSLQSGTNKPYTKLWVQYYAGGEEVIPNARLTILSADSEYYTVAISSIIKNVFQTLRTVSINALNLSALNHLWTAEVARDSVLNDEDYQYLLCEFSDDGEMIGVMGTRADCDERVLRPFVRVKKIMDAIASENKITVEGGLLDETLLTRLFVPITTLENSQQSVDAFLVESHSPGFTLFYSSGFDIEIPLTTQAQSKTMFSDNRTYKARVTGTHYFQFTMYFGESLVTNANYLNLFEYVKIELNGTDTSWDTWGEDADPLGLQVEVSADDEVRFYTNGKEVDTIEGRLEDIIFACRKIDPVAIGRGSLVDVAVHLPPITQYDFFSSMAAYLGYVFSYDSIRNVLKAWRLDEVIENKAKSVDWSEFLSEEKTNTVRYRLNYAQLNRFRWKDDDDVLPWSNDAFIPVLDDSLPATKDVLNMPFASMDTTDKEGELVGRAGWFESQEGTNEYKEVNSISARMAIRQNTDTLAVRYIDSGTLATYDLTAIQSRKAMPASMVETVNRSRALVRMLDRTKYLSLRFNLPASVVKNLNHAIPVYLSQYGQTFFVEKVNNWIYGQTCTVDLIRI